jgi:orotidine-5'-phosphate decarboxylase
MAKAPIILAVDTSDLEVAKSWIKATQTSISVYKLGLEFFLNFGAVGVQEIVDQTGASIFLDLKLHDIPHTVAGAARAVKELHPRFLTVHASGGSSMISAAVKELPDVEITAVTILTSLSEDDLFQVGFANPALESAVALANLSVKAGARAIVCSPLEVAAIRSSVGEGITLITPGVRPTSEAGKDDQSRTMTPSQAIACGASYVVIGRPITASWQQGASAMTDKAAQIAEEILNP